jgi:hypothetical protein
MSDAIEEKMESATIGALAAALAKAQGMMHGAKRESINPQFQGKKYADLASVWEACRAPLSANGLAVTQTVSSGNGGVRVTTTLLHSSGEWMRDRCTFPVTQNTAQGYGSAITYGRRYALAALVGVAPDDDDDGNAASAGAPQQGQVRAQPQMSARSTTEAVKEKLAAKLGASAVKVVPVSAPEENGDVSAVITFTKHKGKRLSDVDDRTVAWFLEKAEEKAMDTADKWHAKNLQWLQAVREEMARRSQ